MWDFTNLILIIVVVATIVFILYDSRKKKRELEQAMSDIDRKYYPEKYEEEAEE